MSINKIKSEYMTCSTDKTWPVYVHDSTKSSRTLVSISLMVSSCKDVLEMISDFLSDAA